jgi:hypothetical protein
MELAVTRSAVLVLVGAHSDHQRRSLGKAVVTEGLRWLKRVGATRALANRYDTQANALYASVPGLKHDLSPSWGREWQTGRMNTSK